MDERIRIISQTNQGLSSARNNGIEQAKSEYLMFVDADDTIINKGISKIINFNKNNNFDLIIFNHSRNNLTIDTNPIKLLSANKTEIFEGVLSGEISTSVCYALIKKEILIKEAVFFPLNKFFEDGFTFHKIIYYSNVPCIIENKFYFYRNRSGSITNTINEVKLNDLIHSLQNLLSFLNDHNLNGSHYLVHARFCSLMNYVINRSKLYFLHNQKKFVNHFIKVIHSFCTINAVHPNIILSLYYNILNINDNVANIFQLNFPQYNNYFSFFSSTTFYDLIFKLVINHIHENILFFGKNSTSDLILRNIELKNFIGYIKSNYSEIIISDYEVFKLKDIDYSKEFTIIIVSLSSSYLLQERFKRQKGFDKSKHKILNFFDSLNL